MTTVGLLHTAPALTDVFERLVHAAGSQAPSRTLHVVDPALLSAAVSDGVDDDVRAGVLDHVRYLQGQGADAVLVTCSSIGEVADTTAELTGLPVLRVDRPMAQHAVRVASCGRGRTVVVLATLASTLGPTQRLVEATARAESTAVRIEAKVVDGASAARAAGDVPAHDRLVAAAIEQAEADADVVVLAQASMASAAARAGRSGVPVLSSPESGVRGLLDQLTTAPHCATEKWPRDC